MFARPLLRSDGGSCQPSLLKLRFLRKGDSANAACDLEVNGYGRLAVEFVSVFVAVMFESVRTDRAYSAAGVNNDSDILRQANVGFSDATFDIGNEIGLAIAREVDIDLSRTHVQIEAGHINVAQSQIAAAGAHIDLDFERNVVGEMQRPVVVGSRADVALGIILRNSQVANGSGDGIIHPRRAGR